MGKADEGQIASITNITYRINGKHNMKCVGKNPRLSQAKSKNDKTITGLLNQIEGGKIVVHPYVNASPFTVFSANTEILSIEFTSNDDTDAQFNASILLDVNAEPVEKTGQATGTITIPPLVEGGTEIIQDENFTIKWNDDGKAVLEVTYILNDKVLTTYHPTATFGSGKHILNLYYPLSGLLANTYNTFKVWLKITGGTATIGRAQGIATISGQGLAANKMWDGRLEFSDDLSVVYVRGGLEPLPFENQVDFKFVPPTQKSLAEGYQFISVGGMKVASFGEVLQVNPVIISETINSGDKGKMTYSTYFVKTETKFELQTKYSFVSSELVIDSGRVCRVLANTEQFNRVDALEVSMNG